MDDLQDKISKPIAIHHKSGSFSSRWIEICEQNSIPFRIVNCYDSDILEQLRDCAGLMWHWSHLDPAAANFARQLTMSAEGMGVPVFPNTKTAWHFDDKLGQKYLLEALNLPHVPSYAFYSKNEAMNFVDSHGLPLVFKLSRGAGSKNVLLLKRRSEAKRVVAKSFKKGWSDSGSNRSYAVTQSFQTLKHHRNLTSLVGVAKSLVRIAIPHSSFKVSRLESGYAYFQEFIPNNDSDIRVIVCGNHAFGLRRMVRKGDFRASGSGIFKASREDIPTECVRIAFESAQKMDSQLAAFDFVFRDADPLIVEISYGFTSRVYAQICTGFWDRDLQWHEGRIDPEQMMIEEFRRYIQEFIRK